MKPKTLLITLIITILGIIFGWYFVFDKIGSFVVFPSEKIESEQSQNQKVNIQTKLIFAESIVEEYSGSYNNGSSPYSVLTEIAEKQALVIEVKEYDFGTLVTSIGNYSNSNERSWIYFVNGKSGDVSADKYELKEGDLVEWKYITPSE